MDCRLHHSQLGGNQDQVQLMNSSLYTVFHKKYNVSNLMPCTILQYALLKKYKVLYIYIHRHLHSCNEPSTIPIDIKKQASIACISKINIGTKHP